MIIISPYSIKLPTGNKNPKNYPWWPEVIVLLKKDGFKEIIQVGVKGELEIGADRIIFNMFLLELAELVKRYQIWVSVDNFFPHFCKFYCNKRGIVIYGQSDPNIFGYPENINLLKDRKYLRQYQFDMWANAIYKEDCFIKPEIVVESIKSFKIV